MKTTVEVQYTYNPTQRKMVVVKNGKAVGGFIGAIAEKLFFKMLDKGVDVKIVIEMSNSKSEKIRRLRAIWIKQGVDTYRGAILEPYGVTSTKELNEVQLDELIARFSSYTSKQNDAPLALRQARSKILKLLDEMGIYSPNNWEAVNNYLMSPKISGKMLYEHNLTELAVLERKLRSIKSKTKFEFKYNNASNN